MVGIQVGNFGIPTNTPVSNTSLLLRGGNTVPNDVTRNGCVIAGDGLLTGTANITQHALAVGTHSFGGIYAGVHNGIVTTNANNARPSIGLSCGNSNAIQLRNVTSDNSTGTVTCLNTGGTLSIPTVSNPGGGVTNAAYAAPALPITFPFG